MTITPPPQLCTIPTDRVSDGAALFHYNQPKISNAFTAQQYLDLRDALMWARDETAIRVVLLSEFALNYEITCANCDRAGKGKHYCAGKWVS